MPHPVLSAAVARASRAITQPSESETTDGRLLEQFIQAKDELAFAELVRRLGPMVLGVCRRIIGNIHLAEDAFQAAFIVLARRANDVRPREGVRGWLYGVAVRTAREARAVSARRRTREVTVPAVPDRPGEPEELPDVDVIRILDEEVGTLPDHLRVTVVLCELEGLSRKVVAERLKIAEGTLSSRLAKARKVLAERLLRRGVVLPTAGLATLGLASAVVPARLTAQTSALAFTTGPLPPLVAALSNGVIRTVFLHKLKATVAGVILLVAALAATRSILPEVSAEEPRKTPPALIRIEEKPQDGKKTQPPTKPAGAGTLILARRGGDYWVLTPDGKKLPDITLPDGTETGARAALSPDGTRAAVIVMDKQDLRPPTAENVEKPWPFKVRIQNLDKPADGKEWEMPSLELKVCWMADGKRLVVAKVTSHSPRTFESVLLDPATGKTEKLDLPPDIRVLDCGRDGKTFLVETFEPKTKTDSLGLAVKGEEKIRELVKIKGQPMLDARLSPDGKKVLYMDLDPERKDFHKWGISQRPYLLDVATKKREPLADFPDNGQACGVAWSPDGKRIAYTWKQLHEDVFKKDTIDVNDAQLETEAFLIVADADGKNAKTIATDKASNAINMILGTIDWR
ncbi:MAG TPA: sigma-70 family RNA polymerase sigma factor [Gemmata sp.]|jgi:RNA polymerase sigma factor (sigma-70 family)|nr:sigma-70 family RNA polymerase sigma factor [Gemmata sp.]